MVREHRLGAGDPRRAPDRRAERQQHDVALLAGRDRARGDGDGLARAAARPAARLARPHRGHRVDVDGRRARRRAHAAAGRRRLRLGAGELQRREGGAARRARVPDGRGGRRVPHAHRTFRSTTRPRSSRPSARPGRRRSIPCRSSRAAARRPVSGCTSTPRTPARRRSAPSCAGASTASTRRLGRRQPAQVALHADGLLGVLDAPPGGVPRGVRARARLPCRDGGGRRPEGLRAGARPPVPRAQAVGGAALVRRRRIARADPRARAARAALRLARRGRAGLGGRRAASVLDRVLPPRRGRQRRRSRARRPRRASCSSRRRGCAGRT